MTIEERLDKVEARQRVLLELIYQIFVCLSRTCMWGQREEERRWRRVGEKLDQLQQEK